jgi:hypothetical protein
VRLDEIQAIAALTTIGFLFSTPINAGSAAAPQDVLKSAVDAAVASVMTRDEISGLVVGITMSGRHAVRLL